MDLKNVERDVETLAEFFGDNRVAVECSEKDYAQLFGGELESFE